MNDYGEEDLSSRDEDDRGQWFEEARARVRTPGLILQWFGIISLIVSIGSLVLLLVDPDLMLKPLYDFQVDMMKKQPPQNQQKLPPYEDFVKSQTTQSIISGLLQMVGSFFILFGGLKMKNLESYGLSIAGSILAMIPCNCCCCIGLIPGIWSLIVLLNSDVRMAFGRVKAGSAL